jgi:hypothetical protein
VSSGSGTAACTRAAVLAYVDALNAGDPDRDRRCGHRRLRQRAHERPWRECVWPGRVPGAAARLPRDQSLSCATCWRTCSSTVIGPLWLTGWPATWRRAVTGACRSRSAGCSGSRVRRVAAQLAAASGSRSPSGSPSAPGKQLVPTARGRNHVLMSDSATAAVHSVWPCLMFGEGGDSNRMFEAEDPRRQPREIR